MDGKQKSSKGLRGLLYHDTFILILSFCAAVVIWFVMMAGSETNRSVIVYDVPISVQLSEAATAEGIKVFNQTYTTADLEIAGNSMITSKLTDADFQVTALLSPTSTKLTGNTLQKDSIQVRAVKTSAISDYTIVSVSPEEIIVEYDRYKEATFRLEPDLKYSADTNWYPGTPALSAEQVTVSGPESSVNKISRAVVSYTMDTPLRADASFSCPVRLYDQNNAEMTDLAGLYLSLNVDTVEVTIPVMAKKTVTINAATLHQPKGFSESRITVEPAQIDIVGSEEALAAIREIVLDTPIDFADLDVTGGNSFVMDIPLPAGVKNISAAGDSTLNQARVSINLNGYKKAQLIVPSENFQISNKPIDKEVQFSAKQILVTLVGSEAQVSKLTGDSLSVQIDLANFADRTGRVEVPVTLAFTGSGSDSCWSLGKYTVFLTLTEAGAESQNAASGSADNGSSSNGVAAAPQE